MSLEVQVLRGRNIRDVDTFGKSDPFCMVLVEGQQQVTQKIEGNLNPDWNETFTFTIGDPNVGVVSFSVLDADSGREDQFIGVAALSLNALQQGEPKEMVLPLLGKNGGAGELHVTLTATDFSGLTAEVDRLQGIGDQLTTQVSEMEEQNAKFAENNAKLTETVTSLEATSDELKSSVADLETVNGELSNTKDELELQVTKFTQKMELLNKQVGELQKTREMLDEQVDRIESQNAQFRTDLANLQTVEAGMREFADKMGEDYGEFVNQLTGNIKKQEELIEEFSAENEKLRQNRKKQQVDSLLAMSNCFQHWDSKIGLSAEEFSGYLELLGPDYTAKLKEKAGGNEDKIFGTLDQDDSGTLNVAELRAILEQLVQENED